MHNSTYEELSQEQKQLLDAAEGVLSNSYSPYSNFAVGAALRTSDGEIILGTNYENASYGLTICAEKVAVANANTYGQRDFIAIAIIAKDGKNHGDEILSPCGSCRQILIEASSHSKQVLQIIMSNPQKDRIIIAKIDELLPLAFSSENLS